MSLPYCSQKVVKSSAGVENSLSALLALIMGHTGNQHLQAPAPAAPLLPAWLAFLISAAHPRAEWPAAARAKQAHVMAQ